MTQWPKRWFHLWGTGQLSPTHKAVGIQCDISSVNTRQNSVAQSKKHIPLCPSFHLSKGKIHAEHAASGESSVLPFMRITAEITAYIKLMAEWLWQTLTSSLYLVTKSESDSWSLSTVPMLWKQTTTYAHTHAHTHTLQHWAVGCLWVTKADL